MLQLRKSFLTTKKNKVDTKKGTRARVAKKPPELELQKDHTSNLIQKTKNAKRPKDC